MDDYYYCIFVKQNICHRPTIIVISIAENDLTFDETLIIS